MFVERLDESDFQEFADKFLNMALEEVEKIDENKIYVRFWNDKFNSILEYLFEDFKCEGINNNNSKKSQEHVTTKWNFFLKQKFGEEYSSSYDGFAFEQANNEFGP